MYEGKSSRLFAKYAVPQMIGLLCNSVYLIVDGVFIGNCLGRDAMAAVAVAVPLVEMMIALSMAVATGAGILVSGCLGRSQRDGAVCAFNLAFWLCGGMGLLLAVLGNVFIHPLAQLFGSTEEIHGMAVEYIRYIVTLSPFLLYSFLLSGLARNDGRPKLAMVALAVGSASNILLDYVFMVPLDMGIGGAALATAVGPVFSVLILLPHFLCKWGALHFARPKLRWKEPGRIFALGFPSFIMEFTIGMVTFVYNFAIVRCGFGEMGLAAYLVIGYLMLIQLTLFLGMAEGLQPVFSYLTATGEIIRRDALRRFSTAVFLAVGVAGYILIVLFGESFFGIFSPGDPELAAFAGEKSLLYFWGFSVAGFNILMISYWQSIQSTGRALAVSLSRSLIMPPLLTFTLPAVFGADALWLCHSLAECITACMAFALLKARHRRM